MKVDIDKYKVNKDFVQKWYKDNKVDPSIAVSTLATSTMVPCIVVAYWIGEVANWPPEIIKTINSLKQFYGYTEILNKPEGSPL